MVGWAADRQDFRWVIPYHEGAVRYWTERGLWTDEAQAHNDALIERQDVLATAWEKVADLPEAELVEKWAEERAAALEAAGLPVYE
jgi:hypothetical protein